MAGVRVALLGAGACVVLAACSTGEVTNLEATSATLNGTVQSGDVGGSYLFQYAKSTEALGTAEGATTPRRTLAANTASKQIAEAVTGLSASTTYAYRLCGRVAGGTADGCLATKRFTTPAPGSRSITFDEPGVHHFTVPAGVTAMQALVVGAGGGAGYNPSDRVVDSSGRLVPMPSDGGKGGSIQGDLLPLTPGTDLEVRVGGAGGDALTVGAFFPGAGGAGGSNGATHGGSGGSGSGAADAARYTDDPRLGSGGGGGGAASEVEQYAAGVGSRVVAMTAGGGGGGGGATDLGADARGGDGGAPATRGTDGVRSDGRDPFSLGGLPGRPAVDGDVPGQGGRGGGQDGAGRNGGAGGTAPEVVWPACTVALQQGGGGGGGGALGGGGGGAGRLWLQLMGNPCGKWTPLWRTLDGASGGAGGLSDLFVFFNDPILNSGVNAGDGFVTLSWKVPAAG